MLNLGSFIVRCPRLETTFFCARREGSVIPPADCRSRAVHEPLTTTGSIGADPDRRRTRSSPVPGFRQLISWFFAILPGFHGLAVHLPTAKPGLAAKAEQNFFHLVFMR
ncbi:hypothetical protein [Mesorhizobium sp.]|uniref:hypothetical protein n=1 Tax=Mesorhizobium sp. TaxID=1871066 RepID=UPI0025E2DEF6|nr:hypothetical protein [Mesorhizobium sp.]